MKRIFYRIFAFVIDMLIVSFMAVGLSSIKFINPNLYKSNELTKNYLNVVNEYTKLNKKLDNYFEDSILTEKEISKITQNYPSFKDFTTLNGYMALDPIDDKLENKMRDKIEEDYVNYVKEYNYNITRKNIYSLVILIVCYVFYFVILQFLMNGQTLGKKLMRLRVKSVDNKELSILSYFIRCILVCEILFMVLDLILVNVLRQNAYLNTSNYLVQIRYLYDLAFVICLVIRDDNRSIHDILLKTKVVRFDKSGNEIIEEPFKTNFNNNALIEEDTKKTSTKSKKK